MNKKGTTHQWWEILIIVLAILVFAILAWNYYGNKGVFIGVKDAAQTIWSYAPNVMVGLKALNATTVTLPGKQGSEVSSLKTTIELMLASGKENCFAKIDNPLEDLGTRDVFEAEEATHITATFDQSAQETVFIIGTAGGQIYKTFRIKMKPCVVAGPYNAAENFFNHFNKNLDLKEPYYNVVAGVDIFYREGMVYTKEGGWEASWYNGNVIRVLGFPENMVNDENENFQNGGILFKGKDNEICFFPTNKAINANIDGIDDDYIGNPNDEESLLYKWNHGVNKCY